MSDRNNVGDLNVVCGLLDSISYLRSLLLEVGNGDESLDDYPLAESWCQIFDDYRIDDVIAKIGAEQGLDLLTLESLCELRRALLSADTANSVNAQSAGDLAGIIQRVLRAADTWINENCDGKTG